MPQSLPLSASPPIGYRRRRSWPGRLEQENQLTKHDGEITTLQRDSDRILVRLDEFLRELRGQK